MKVLCILSSSPGHIDFGGMGFLQIAERLKECGDSVTWLTPSIHKEKLVSKGFETIHAPASDKLCLQPFSSVEEIARYQDEFSERIEYLRSLYSLLASTRPDIILLDRALPMALLASEQLQIPCVAVGTPGGYWEKSDIYGTHSIDRPVSSYVEVGEIINKKLGWKSGELSSFWANSQHLNICFLGRPFYQVDHNQCSNVAFVRHFNDTVTGGTRSSFGISFGNSGEPDKLAFIIQCILSIKNKIPVEVFSGSRKELYHNLERHFGKLIRLHDWVNFSEYFPALKGVAFLGGVGTLWECLNHEVPMLVVPSKTGDQISNGHSVSRLGMGEMVEADDVNNPESIQVKLGWILTKGIYGNNIKEFKESKYYTDTLETIVNRIHTL